MKINFYFCFRVLYSCFYCLNFNTNELVKAVWVHLVEKTSFISVLRDDAKGRAQSREKKTSCLVFSLKIASHTHKQASERGREGWLDALKTVSDWVAF
jgi:hypothetical protein